MVQSKPLPFPPEPIAWLGVTLTRASLKKADRNEGKPQPVAAYPRPAGPRLRLLTSVPELSASRTPDEERVVLTTRRGLEAEGHHGRRPTVEQGRDHRQLVRYDRVGQRVEGEPPQVSGLVRSRRAAARPPTLCRRRRSRPARRSAGRCGACGASRTAASGRPGRRSMPSSSRASRTAASNTDSSASTWPAAAAAQWSSM